MPHKPTVIVLAILLWTGLHPVLRAQQMNASINFLMGTPEGAFAENVDNKGFGVGLTFGTRLGSNPIVLGLDFGYLVYGSETRKEALNPNIPEVTVDVNTTNNLVLGHLLFRLQGDQGVVRPFLDGLLGLHYLFTDTEVTDPRDVFANAPIASSTNFEDLAFSYGAGGGAMVVVYTAAEKPEEGVRLRQLLLEIRVRYLFGGKADYLKKGSIRREGDDVIFDINRSTTDLLTLQVGFAVTF